jgi:hypothetical protein
MKRTIPVDLPGKIIGLLFLFGGASVSIAQGTDLIPSASTQAIVSEARLNLVEARKTRSDARTAVEHYLVISASLPSSTLPSPTPTVFAPPKKTFFYHR